MNRTNSFIVTIFSELITYSVAIILGFIVPNLIISLYGSEFNGLQSSVMQVMNMILLLQAGTMTVSIFSLYNPIANSDYEQISSKVSTAEQYFHFLARIFFIILIFVSIIFCFSIKTTINRKIVFVYFFILGIKSFLDLYFTSKYRIVFTAFQQRYIVSIATLIEQFVYYGLVIIIITKKLNFLLIGISFLLGGITRIVFLFTIYRVKFKNKISKRKNEKFLRPENQRYSFANEISHSTTSSSIVILMSIMYGLKETSVFSIFYLIWQGLMNVMNAVSSAFEPGFGNVIAIGDFDRASKIFRAFQYVYNMIVILFIICMQCLLIPFINVYIKNVSDIKYANYLLAVLLSLFGIFYGFRIPYNILVSSCGYFKETWKQPVVSSLGSLLISISLGQIRYELLIVGPILFYFTNYVYQFFKIKRINPNLISGRVWGEFFLAIFFFICSYFVAPYLFYINSFTDWLIVAIKCFFFMLFLLFIYSVIFRKIELSFCINYFKRLFF